jgi:O-antigen ligase
MANASAIPMSIRWSLLLYAFSLPFETVDLPFASGILSLAKITGILVLASCLLHYRSSYSRPHLAFWCFGAYFLILYVRAAADAGQLFGGGFLSLFLTRVQLVILTWLITKPLKDRRLAVGVFVTFSVASILIAAGMTLRLSGFSEGSDDQRISALGANQNAMGAILALALTIVIGLFLAKGLLRLRSKMLLGTMSLTLLMGVLLTGSRTALIALFVGIATYLLPVGGIQSVLKNTFFILFCLAALVASVIRDPLSMSRLAQTYYQGDSSGREGLWQAALDMSVEKPFLGWGPVEWENRLGKDVHNHYLYLLLEVGIIGTIPYIGGLVLCLRNIWKSRDTDWGKICLAAFSMLMISNLGFNFPSFKTMWFVIAVCLAVGRTDNTYLSRNLSYASGRSAAD